MEAAIGLALYKINPDADFKDVVESAQTIVDVLHSGMSHYNVRIVAKNGTLVFENDDD